MDVLSFKTDVPEYKRDFRLLAVSEEQAMFLTCLVMKNLIKERREAGKPLKKIQLRPGHIRPKRGYPFQIDVTELPFPLEGDTVTIFGWEDGRLKKIDIPLPESKTRTTK